MSDQLTRGPVNIRVRRTDPETSVAAAESVERDLTRRQNDVLWVLQHAVGDNEDGCTDYELTLILDSMAKTIGFARQSPSGIRTRRSELVRMGKVYDTGERGILPSGRKSIKWKAVS